MTRDLSSREWQSFRQHLTDMRTERPHLNQERIAEGVGVQKQTISKYEQGRSVPDLLIFVALCRYFEVDPNTILGWDDAGPQRLDARTQTLIKRYLELPENWQLTVSNLVTELRSDLSRVKREGHG
ncbi:helix-turn-helix transcriptional regulator [Devosia sp. 2618]|uniref:helix-turn-helix transcriptional regulator n=1 Tax=Devosia sp. 2618 TaxID=3156454 RepID=UPI0033977C2F